KSPVNYVLPPGVTRETDPSQPQLLQQNEQSMVLRVADLSAGEARAVYKNTTYDMRKYKRLQMFVHGEAMVDAAAQAQNLKDYELSCFIRFGSDMVNNYYEYEIPLKLTKPGVYLSDKLADREEVWQPSNMFDFPFTVLTDAKLKRNKARQQGQTGVSNSIPFVVFDESNQNNKITIMGNPNISEVENIMIGIRNVSGNTKSGEVWVNEMRMSEFDENPGWAGLANLSVGLSDLGSLNVSGRAETSGFGGLESTITNRSLDDTYQMNLSAALDLGRFLPEQIKLQIPAYFTYTTETVSPKYNPLDNDILLRDALDNLQDKFAKDSLKNLSQSVVTTKSFNVTNAKINVKSKKPKFYDPANVAFTLSSSETDEHTPEIFQNLNKQQRAAVNYSFSFNNEPWEPFKKSKGMKSPALKLIKDFNVYYLPTTLSYNTSLNRVYSQILLRDLISGVSPLAQPDGMGNISSSKDFMWNRQFDLQYNITRSLKVGLQTATNANIAEPRFTPEIGKEYYEQWRDTVWYNIKKMGTPYTYQQVFDASWKIPIDKLPLLDWVTSNAQYNSTYSWNRSATMEGGSDIGNVASSMGSFSLDGTLNFENLYNKVKYLKDVNTRSQAALRSQPYVSKTFRQTVNLKAGTPLTVNHALGSQRFSFTAKD
ncbi:MAG TPA: cell surface protein SprA, partial [Paludibacteraceae bacterium]|nr:cell surface protein SprA [Paludibacteraceae bacterium]